MKTLTEFFGELAQQHANTLKKSTKHYKSADKMLKRQLGRGTQAYVKNHIAEKKREFAQIKNGIGSVDYYKKAMVAAKGLLMPKPTTDPARLYIGSDGHPRICKEFDFPREDGVLTNKVRIFSQLCTVEWSMKRKVSLMEWAHVQYLERPKRNLAIPHALLQWMVHSADWWPAITFCVVNVGTVYSMIQMNVGKYAGVDGHRNVVCGCAYNTKVLEFVVSTSRPHVQAWARTIDLSRPMVLLQNTIYVPMTWGMRDKKETNYRFHSIIKLGGHCSSTYDRGPKRFHRCAKQMIGYCNPKSAQASWK